jgi:hypothetical protein
MDLAILPPRKLWLEMSQLTSLTVGGFKCSHQQLDEFSNLLAELKNVCSLTLDISIRKMGFGKRLFLISKNSSILPTLNLLHGQKNTQKQRDNHDNSRGE